MSVSLVRVLLRASAIAMAVAALIDPVFSSSTSHERPVVVIHLTAHPPVAIESALKGQLRGRDLTTRVPDGIRLPCAVDEDCVAIADGSIDSEWETARPVAMITTDVNAAPNVSVQSVVLSGGHRSAAGAARLPFRSRSLVHDRGARAVPS